MSEHSALERRLRKERVLERIALHRQQWQQAKVYSQANAQASSLLGLVVPTAWQLLRTRPWLGLALLGAGFAVGPARLLQLVSLAAPFLRR